MSTLDNLRKNAKRWLKALRANDPEARARLERAWNRAPATPGLRDVQHALAREAGHEHWKAMIDAVGREERGRPALETGGATSADRVATFLEFACWDHHVHGKGDHRLCDRAAQRLLAQHPEIARDSLFTAIVCGDVGHVQRLLDERPDAAREPGGARGWPPLLYLCYTRFSHAPAIEHAVAIGRLLLDRGANPNDFYMAGDSHYTALVGAAGEGEQDSPRQPQGQALFRLLLERGAEPFDIQVLYNTHFSGDVLWWLELIHEHTRNTNRREAWLDPQWSMLDMGPYGSGARFLLSRAIEKNNTALAEWLLIHGADPNAPPASHPRFSKRSLYEDALWHDRRDIAHLLRQYGAEARPLSLTDEEAFVAACLRGDRQAVARRLEQHPEYLRSPTAIFEAARANRPDAVALLLELGVPIEIADSQQQRTLHVAASHNALDVARLLIQRGAEIDPRESNWNAAPIGFASHHDHLAMLDLLSEHSRNVWTLAFRGYVDRLRAVLDADPSLARAVAKDGTTPLWWLPDDDAKALAIVEILIAHGADASAKDKNGRTALDWALKRGMREAAGALSKAAGARGVVHVPAPPPATTPGDYEQLARDLVRVYESGDPAALERINTHYRRSATSEDVRAGVWKRLRTVREAGGAATAFGVNQARELIARESGFGNWNALSTALAAGTSASGPAYAIDRRSGAIRPRRELSDADWNALIEVMKERRIAALDAGGLMTDAVLARVATLGHVTSLSLGGSRQLTDDGLQHLARMPQLVHLQLNTGRITDRGLEVLRHLPRLRRFEINWQQGITDAGVANLRFCDDLESVDLMGTATGDGAIAALAGKQRLARLKTGKLVTDDGLRMLSGFPVFTAAEAGEATCSLMSPEAGPSHLMLDGPFTHRGVASLAALSGLVSLSFFWHVPALVAGDLALLAHLPNLQFLGCGGELCDDAAMNHISALPRLRMLMAQGTVATDEGFTALSRSRSIEYSLGT